MSANQPGPPVQTLTINDVRHHAEEVRDLAKAEVRKISRTEPARVVAFAVVGILVVASLAYYVGSRRCPSCDPGS